MYVLREAGTVKATVHHDKQDGRRCVLLLIKPPGVDTVHALFSLFFFRCDVSVGLFTGALTGGGGGVYGCVGGSVSGDVNGVFTEISGRGGGDCGVFSRLRW